jgi:O-antigen/teichoic acid export membrane protein
MTDSVTARPPRSRATAARPPWSRMVAGRSLGISSLVLVLGKAAQMGTGFLFWVVAARSAAVSEVGLAVATVSAVLLCTQLALLGAGSAVITQLHREGDGGHGLLDTAFTIVLFSGALVGFGYLAITARFSPDLAAVLADPGSAVLFVVATVFGTVMICLDQVSVAIGKAHQQATRYAVTGVLTVALVLAAGAAVGHLGAAPLFACWAVGSVVACALGAVQLARSIRYRYRPTRDRRRARRLLSVGMPNQLLTLTERLPPLLVPVLVADLIAPHVAAYWYPVWMTTWGIYTAPIMVGLVQFADIVRRPEDIRATAAAALRWSLLIGGPLAVAVAVVAEPLLSLLGAAYADASVTALRVLVLGLLPYALIQSYNSVCRALNKLREAVIVGVLGAAAACAATVVTGMGGDVTGMAIGWVGTQCVVACWAGARLWRLAADGRAFSPAAGGVEVFASVARPAGERQRRAP